MSFVETHQSAATKTHWTRELLEKDGSHVSIEDGLPSERSEQGGSGAECLFAMTHFDTKPLDRLIPQDVEEGAPTGLTLQPMQSLVAGSEYAVGVGK
eukprot:2781082-Pyramimonas_sp.AAC.1